MNANKIYHLKMKYCEEKYNTLKTNCIPSLPSPLANNRASTYSGLLPVSQEVIFCNNELDSGTNIVIL